MLEKLPPAIGHLLKNVKAGAGKTLYLDDDFSDVPEVMSVISPAFENLQRMPARFTADGEKISPPLFWRGIPAEARSLVLVIEDADSPTPRPLTHGIVIDLPPYEGGLDEGVLPSPHHEGLPHHMGTNSYFRSQYLPPDPPPGHGDHHYLFQLFALNIVLAEKAHPSASALKDAIRGHVIGKGLLIGTYSRS